MVDLPEGEALRRAVRWISERLGENPDTPLMRLVDQATLRFDLDPNQAEFLISFYRDARRRPRET